MTTFEPRRGLRRRHHRPTRRGAGLAEHLRDALWRVDSSARAPSTRRAADCRRHGRFGRRRAARARRAGAAAATPVASPTATRCPAGPGRDTLVLCSSYSGATEETLAAYEDAVARGAPRIVATTGGPLAERARADGVPVIPLPGGFQPRAAIGYGSSPRWRRHGWPAPRRRCATRSRPRRCSRSGSRASGARTARRRRGQGARTRTAWHGAGDRGRRTRCRGGLPLEVPVQRERRRCRRSRPSCRRPTTTRSSAGTRRANSGASRTSRWRTLRRTRATCCGRN